MCTLILVRLLLLYTELFINTRIRMSLRRTHQVSQEEQARRRRRQEQQQQQQQQQNFHIKRK